MKFLVRRWHRVTGSGSININKDGFGLHPGEVKTACFLMTLKFLLSNTVQITNSGTTVVRSRALVTDEAGLQAVSRGMTAVPTEGVAGPGLILPPVTY